MKRAALILVLGLGLCRPAHAQLAVVDHLAALGISKETIETVKNGITELQQAQTLVTQLQWMESLTTNLVHDPNLGTIMQIANLLGLQSDLPVNLYAVQSLLSGYGGMNSLGGLLGTAGGKLSTLGSVVNTTYNNDNLYTCNTASFGCAQTNQEMNGLAGGKGAISQMVASLQNHLTVLQGLQARASTAANPKDAADVNNQIATQQAWITGQQAQINGVAAMTAMQGEISKVQAQQSWLQDTDGFTAAVK